MFFHFFQYVKFLLNSTNQHGVHSPFVYRLVTTCFYTKVDKKQIAQYREIQKSALQVRKVNLPKRSYKKPELLLKVIGYFKPITSLEIGNASEHFASTVKIAQPNATVTTITNTPETADDKANLLKAINSKPYDMVFFNSTEKATLSYFESCLSSVHNETFFIFKDLYQSKEMRTTWAKIKQHPKIIVTVDVYDYGFVFMRKEQQKEHFKIRL